MLHELKKVQEEYDKLYKQKQEYENVLRRLEGRKNPLAIVVAILDKYIPGRSCPNCFEDCLGWIVDGNPCNGRESE